MSQARSFSYGNRLAKIVIKQGGKTAAQAISMAEQRVEEMREPALAQIDKAIAEISELCRSIPDVHDPGVDLLYAAANRVLAVAGIFSLAELGTAAYSLCEATSRMQAAETWNPSILLVHSNALVALRHPEAHSEAERLALLNGLSRLVGKVG